MGRLDVLLRRADHGDGGQDNQNVMLLRPELFAIQALEGVELTGEEARMLKEVRKGNREGRQEDAVATIARELALHPSAAPKAAEWLLEDRILLFRGKVYVPQDPSCDGGLLSNTMT
jgi:hypothetical protein